MKIKLMYVSFAFILLCTPLFVTVLGSSLGKTVKKGTVPFPALNNFDYLDYKVQPFLDLSTWFEANHGAEGVLIRIWNQLRWSLFGMSDELVIGQDGWIEDRKTVRELIPATDAIESEEIKQTTILIKRFQHFLESKGITFVMTIVPFKITVYPEYFPQIPRRNEENKGIVRYQKALERNNVPFVDSYSVLSNSRGYVTYYKTDLHFNTVGAKLVGDAIVSRLYDSLSKPKPFSINDKVSYQFFDGGSANTALPKLIPFTEEVPTIHHTYVGKTSLVKVANNAVDAMQFLTNTGSKELLPPTILFGNSFTLSYPVLGFHDYFEETLRVLDYQDFNKALDIIQPNTKIVILHVYETQMLFHVSHKNSFNYWDKRVYDLPLPKDFKYEE